MKNKNNTLLLLIPIIIIVFFNIVVFSVLHQYTDTFWLSYSLTTISMLLFMAIGSKFALKEDQTVRDLFFGLPLLQISITYAAVQLIIGFLFMMIPNVNFTLAMIVQIFILAVYLILAISAIFGKNTVERIDRETAEKIFFIRDLTSDVEMIIHKNKNPELAKKLSELKDAVKYSDPMSNPSLASIEMRISTGVQKLKSGEGNAEEIIENLMALIFERNMKCKNLK